MPALYIRLHKKAPSKWIIDFTAAAIVVVVMPWKMMWFLGVREFSHRVNSFLDSQLEHRLRIWQFLKILRLRTNLNLKKSIETENYKFSRIYQP